MCYKKKKKERIKLYKSTCFKCYIVVHNHYIIYHGKKYCKNCIRNNIFTTIEIV